MRDDAQQAAGENLEPADGQRTDLRARQPQRKDLVVTELTRRQKFMCQLMVYGLDRQSRFMPDLPLNTPLTLEQAADALDIRRRHARHLAKSEPFRKEMAMVLSQFAKATRPRNLHRLVEVRDSEGEGTAADRTVQLKAALALEAIAEPQTQRAAGGTSLNVHVSANFTPGYIIAPPDRPRPVPATIEHEPSEQPQ